MNTGTKTSSPVDHDSAKCIYDKLVPEKKAKGYTEGPDGTPYQHTDKEERATGILPQLLNPIDERTCDRLLQGTQFCMQEKFDGKRMLIRKTATGVVGINRKGLVVALPEPIRAAAATMPFDCLLDGEAVGDLFHAFDMLEGEKDVRQQRYQDRYMTLVGVLLTVAIEPGAAPAIRIVDTFWNPTDKRTALAKMQERKAEGVVFKDIHAPYAIGRPNSGGPQLKHKFYATLSAVVATVNENRSVGLILFESHGEFGGDPVEPGIVPLGNVSIPPNHEVPSEGAVVDRLPIKTISNSEHRKEHYAELVAQQTHPYGTRGRL